MILQLPRKRRMRCDRGGSLSLLSLCDPPAPYAPLFCFLNTVSAGLGRHLPYRHNFFDALCSCHYSTFSRFTPQLCNSSRGSRACPEGDRRFIKMETAVSRRTGGRKEGTWVSIIRFRLGVEIERPDAGQDDRTCRARPNPRGANGVNFPCQIDHKKLCRPGYSINCTLLVDIKSAALVYYTSTLYNRLRITDMYILTRL